MNRGTLISVFFLMLILGIGFAASAAAIGQAHASIRYLVVGNVPADNFIGQARFKVSQLSYDLTTPNARGTFIYDDKDNVKQQGTIEYAVIIDNIAYVAGPIDTKPGMWIYAVLDSNQKTIALREATPDTARTNVISQTFIPNEPTVSGNVGVR